MKDSFERIPGSLSQEPIKIPGSPFWNVFKRFGRDEAIAMVVNVAGTAIMGFLTANAFILSLTGPVVEKFGFFPGHFKEALGIYKTTPSSDRKPISFYFKKALKGGSKSLLEDVLVHDPFYIAFMFIGLKLYSNTPVWLLAFASFLIAVLIVAFGEVMVTELGYWNFKRRLKKKRFGVEKYYESRFLISSKQDPVNALKMVADAFNFAEERGWTYTDTYFENKLPEYSGRIPKLRLRQRGSGEDKVQTAQITYTRAYELSNKKLEQYRYFPISKEKIYFMLQQDMPKSIEEIKESKVRGLLKKAVKSAEPRIVKFERILARSPDLLVSVDKVHGADPFFLLELKTHRHVKLLKEAMRFVMQELPVIHTTQGKKEIVFR
ncbi:MAG: hypothetical protein KJ955_01730 [Nanoarchaeota archaeon]|nr:hypothetical protein [Nanoarchaeota archaeon]